MQEEPLADTGAEAGKISGDEIRRYGKMIEYMKRTRAYYAALGYPAYGWAHHTEIPFANCSRPLADTTLALITTAALFRPELGDQGPGAAYNAQAKFFTVYTVPVEPLPDLRISHLSYDRKHCAAEDPATWLPVAALNRAVLKRHLHRLASEVIGVPTNRSQRVTTHQDAPAALEHCRRLSADAALLVPT